jgi:hypothetical protein
MAKRMLPVFGGATNSSGCQNPDCDASDQYIRVVSRVEMERMFPQQSEMEFTPLPPQATHVCDRCGWAYNGIRDGRFEMASGESLCTDRPTVDIDEYEWDPESSTERTVRESARSLVMGAPDDADRAEVREAIERYVPGIGDDDVSMILDSVDRDFADPGNMAEFM